MGGSSPIQSADWDDRKVRHTFIRKVSLGHPLGGWGHGLVAAG